ncbi:hypothetical protein LUZ60_000817 [Juncus effusus]|nr:hypothetical protein LUZ60_000817 [Juncus effusus]
MTTLLRRLSSFGSFYKKPPDGVLSIADNIYLFDRSYSLETLEETEFKSYIDNTISELNEHNPDGSYMVFNFGAQSKNQSQISCILTEQNMTVMDYPRDYEGCPLLPMETLHHFLKSSENWLSHEKSFLLMHSEQGGWPVLAFVLSALLIYLKHYTDEIKTLDMIYKQASNELLQLLTPLDPMPSQLRYLHYVSIRNVGSEWPPPDRAVTLDSVIIRLIPNFDGQDGCRPLFRVYGLDPSLPNDHDSKLLFSNPKDKKSVLFYRKADSEIVKIGFNCRIKGDVVLECVNVDESLERETMVFRVMFNTAFIRSNFLTLTRDEVDLLWGSKDHFAKFFRIEMIFSDMDLASPEVEINIQNQNNEGEEGLPQEAFSKVRDFFPVVSWLADHSNSQSKQENTKPPSQKPIDNIVSKDKSIYGAKSMNSEVKPNSNSSPVNSEISDLLNGGLSSVNILKSNFQKIANSEVKTDATPSLASIKSQVHNTSSVSQKPEFPPKSNPSVFLESEKANTSLAVIRQPSSEVLKEQLSPSRFSSSPFLLVDKTETKNNNNITSAPSKVINSLKSNLVSQQEKSSPNLGTPTNDTLPLSNSLTQSKPSTIASKIPPPPPPPLLPASSAHSHPSTKETNDDEISPIGSSKKPSTIIPLPPPPPPKSSTSASPPPPPPPPPLKSNIAVSLPPTPPPPPPKSTKSSAPPPPPKSSTTSATPKSSSSSAPPPGGKKTPPGPPPPPPPKAGGKPGGPPPPPPPSGGKPGGPPPPPPSKGRPLGPSKIPNSLTAKPIKKVNLKPLHWSKVSRAAQGSLWAETQPSKAPEINFTELENLFAVNLPDPKASSRRSAAAPKSEIVSLIEPNRARNCEIILKKLKIPFSEVTNAVLALDDSVLEVEQVDNIVKFCPTKEEIALLKNYTGDKDKLGKCDQFFLEIMKVPRFEPKATVLSFKIKFRNLVAELKGNLSIVNAVVEEVRCSVKLKRIMQTILSLGNAINQGTARGSAVGFKLDSLPKLSDTRARDNKTTLMHYLCKVLAEKLPEVLDFSLDLIHLEPSSRIQLKDLAEVRLTIQKGLEQVEQELSSSENGDSTSETFQNNLKEFLELAEAEVRSVTALYSVVGRSADALVRYFGEDPARCPFETVISTLLNFVKMFEKAHMDNLKNYELEKKKAEKEAAEREKENSKQNTPKSQSNVSNLVTRSLSGLGLGNTKR